MCPKSEFSEQVVETQTTYATMYAPVAAPLVCDGCTDSCGLRCTNQGTPVADGPADPPLTRDVHPVRFRSATDRKRTGLIATTGCKHTSVVVATIVYTTLMKVGRMPTPDLPGNTPTMSESMTGVATAGD